MPRQKGSSCWCGDPHYALGLCRRHYHHFYRLRPDVKARLRGQQRERGQPDGFVDVVCARQDWFIANLGDYFVRERDDPGLLEEPHPYDPNRFVATPASGYGWPTLEWPIHLLGRIVKQAAKDDRERARGRRRRRR